MGNKYLKILSISVPFKKKLKIDDVLLNKYEDNKLLELVYNLLELENYKFIGLQDDKIEINGDLDNVDYRYKPIWSYTQTIKNATITVENIKNRRSLMFYFIMPIDLVSGLIIGLFFGILERSYLLGILLFLIALFVTTIITYIIQIMTISGTLDKLEYNEKWKPKK